MNETNSAEVGVNESLSPETNIKTSAGMQNSDTHSKFSGEPKKSFETSPEAQKHETSNAQTKREGKSQDPNLILGKFKSTDDLTKAYQELQKLQGLQSEELGNLRQHSLIINKITEAWEVQRRILESENELRELAHKYDSPEYFQDPSFREIYREAYLALGDKLNPEKLINMLEGYVSARLFAHEKQKSAQEETKHAIEGMKFDKNDKSSLNPPKKRLDEMTQKEYDEFLDRLI